MTPISPELVLNFFCSRMANISSSISSDRDIRYCADISIVRRRTVIFEALESRHSSFIINIVKHRECYSPASLCLL